MSTPTYMEPQPQRSPLLTALVAGAIIALVAANVYLYIQIDHVRTDLNPSMGAEDFAFMLHRKPGCYIWIGNGPGDGGCTLHNPHYDFNDDVLTLGSTYWVRLAESILQAG